MTLRYAGPTTEIDRATLTVPVCSYSEIVLFLLVPQPRFYQHGRKRERCSKNSTIIQTPTKKKHPTMS